MLRIGLTSFTGLAAVLVVIALATDGRPSAALFLPVLALLVANHAVLVPNVNAAAMEPVGAVAGTASAVLGATSMAAGAIIGAFVDGAYDGTITPLSWAFLAAGLVALGVLHRRPPRPPRRDAGRFLGVALAALIGAFMSYLASSELIIEDTLGLDGAFPIVFGGLAVGMGVATFTNRRFVEAAGTWGVLRIGLTSFTGLAAVLVVIALATDGRPSAALFLPVLALVVANHAVLVPNVNAAAMEPVGAVAGTASAVLGATSMAAGAIIGAFVDGAFDGTITPLSWAFLAAGLVALACFTAAHRVHRDVTRAVTVVAAD